jgi:hypothetical protein
VTEDVTALFEEYASAYARGERPQVREYLRRAGDGADELATLLDRFLAAAPPPEPAAETVALVAAWAEGEPPLVHLRASRGVRLDDVVDALVGELALDPAKRPKVKDYYQRLEQGLLEPARVSERVWVVVQQWVGERAEAAAAGRPPAGGPASAPAAANVTAYLRPAAPSLPTPLDAVPRSHEPSDEIDVLFLSAR